jgi:epoxyqueuosine reductase
MVFQSINESLYSKLRTHGYEARVIPIHRLADLKDEIKNHYLRGMFNVEFFEERLTRFNFDQPGDMPEAKTIIVVAIPSPRTGVLFHWKGGSKTLILPPTYVGYSTLPAKMEMQVNEILNPMGYRAMKTLNFPIKPLAVHSGLAEYGRNNITYIEGMGSFHHLFAFYSDMPCEQDEWREMKMLERCAHCRACIIKCPTGAIGEDRFLLHAERCLSFHNEKPADVPFPTWIDPSWHNSLYGCMICQRFCPEDKKFKDWIETQVEFSEKETALLLNEQSQDLLTATIVEILYQLELVESLDVLPRNLGVLLRNLSLEFKM